MGERAGGLLRARGGAMKYCYLAVALGDTLQLTLPKKPEEKKHDSMKGPSCEEEVSSRVV